MSYPYHPNQDAEGLHHHVKSTPALLSQESSLGNWDGNKPRSTRTAPTMLHITPTADRLGQHSTLGNRDGRNLQTPYTARTRFGVPTSATASMTLSAEGPHVTHGYVQGGYQMNAAPVDRHPPRSQTGNNGDGNYMVGGLQKGVGQASSSCVGAPPSRGEPGPSRSNANVKEEQYEILRRYYRTRNKKPSYEERSALSEETGLQTEVILQWFHQQRHFDPSYVPGACKPPAPRAPNKFTQSERQVLEQYLLIHGAKVPRPAERLELAEQLGVGTEVIYNWFRNRIQRMKRNLRSGRTPRSRPPVTSQH